MMYKSIGLGALLLAASLVPATLPAQSQDDKPATTSVTGCVAAGKKAGTYKLTADDGTVYMLRSKSTNLGEHVGHTVTVSGRVMSGANGSATPSNSANSSDATGADQNSAGANGAAAGGAMKNHLMVHKLTMVSESCKTAQ